MTSLHEPMGITSRVPGRGRRIAVISAHTSPLATLGGRETGGMNVYVRELSRELGARGVVIDVFTRWASADAPETQPFSRTRVVHIAAAKGRSRRKRSPRTCRSWRNRWREAGGAAHDMVHSHWMSALSRRTWQSAGACRTSPCSTRSASEPRLLKEHEPASRVGEARDREAPTASWWRASTRSTC
jgi:D-inositol-3-phosphate glycosyltransferase